MDEKMSKIMNAVAKDTAQDVIKDIREHLAIGKNYTPQPSEMIRFRDVIEVINLVESEWTNE